MKSTLFLTTLACFASFTALGNWKIGVASTKITPDPSPNTPHSLTL